MSHVTGPALSGYATINISGTTTPHVHRGQCQTANNERHGAGAVMSWGVLFGLAILAMDCQIPLEHEGVTESSA